MPPIRTQDTNITSEGSFERLGFPVVSRDEALAAAKSVVVAAQTRAPPRQKRTRRAKTQSRSAPISRILPTPPITPPTTSNTPEEDENQETGSDAESSNPGSERDPSDCSCGRQCVAEILTDSSKWRKPAHLSTGHGITIEPECHWSFEWSKLICERCAAGRQLDVGIMTDEALLAVNMNGKIKHIHSGQNTWESRFFTGQTGTEQSLIHLIHHSPSLQSAHLKESRSRNVFFALVSSCPALLSIHLSGDSDYTDPAELWALAEHPEWVPNLRELSLSSGRMFFHPKRMQPEGLGLALTTLANARPNLIFSFISGRRIVWARIPPWISFDWYQDHRRPLGNAEFDLRDIVEATPFVSNWA